MDMVMNSIIGHWEVNFARFVCFPASSSMAADLIHHPILTPQAEGWKKRRRGGVWISTPSATVKFITDFCTESHESVLMVTLGGKVMEEHYTSRLHISWPQVSCMSGFPPRGTRAVILSYKDCQGQVQRFALRFSTVEETEMFIDVVKVIMEGSELPRAELNSGLSSQSEDTEDCRLSDSADIGTHTQGTSNSKATYQSNALSTIPNCGVEDFTSDFPASDSADISTHNKVTSNSKATDQSNAYATIPNCGAEDVISDFPPSFSSFLMNCCPPAPKETPRTTTQEVDLKAEFAKFLEDASFQGMSSSSVIKFLEDASFQDLLFKVENVMNELGDSIIF